MNAGGEAGLLRAIVPGGVHAAEIVDFGQDVHLREAESGIVAAAGARHVRDFTLGRDCAHRALQDMGIVAEAILRREDGAPRWPGGVVGSITHTEGYAAAAVAAAAQMAGIGIDAERISGLADNVVRRIFTPEEHASLDVMVAPDRAAASIVMFSAKEACFKACASMAGRLGFRDIQVKLVGGRLFANVSGHEVEGRWLVSGDLVVTGVFVPAV